jgi:hypothetical protein
VANLFAGGTILEPAAGPGGPSNDGTVFITSGNTAAAPDTALATVPRLLFLTINPSAGAGVAAPIGSVALTQVGGAGATFLKTAAADNAWTAYANP